MMPSTVSRYPSGSHLVYFVGDEGDLDGYSVKFGITGQEWPLRRNDHEHRGPTTKRMVTLALVLGFPSDEKAIKRHFADVLAKGKNGSLKEWIDPEKFGHPKAKQFVEYIHWLRDKSFVATIDDDVADLQLTDSSEWLPNGKARKAKYVDSFLPFNNKFWTPADDITEGDFYTPPEWTRAASRAMGGIDLDPASCKKANNDPERGVRAKRFFNFREDGLRQPWGGNVWLNPPFGAWEVWAVKAIAELNRGVVRQMCVLMTSRTTTAKSVHPLLEASSAMLMPNGRGKFWGPKAAVPNDGCVILYFGEDASAFEREFRQFGTVFLKASK